MAAGTITPSPVVTNQIYTLVNEIASQSLGEKAITVVDAASLVSLGNVVMNQQNTEAFLNTLSLRIGRTIFADRLYTNQNDDMVLNDFEYGMIMQKIYVDLPEAEEDMTYKLEDGKSVDQYVVHKPQASQKLFAKRTPYEFSITISRKLLKEAFLSESAMGSFISYVFNQVRNAVELAMENLGNICLANFIAESTNEIKLGTLYTTATGNTVTPANAFQDEEFLRFAVSKIKSYSKKLTSLSVSYNMDGNKRHTPFNLQRLRILSDFQTALETSVQYAAIHDNFVSLEGYREKNYWQAEDDPMTVMVTRASDETDVTVNNVIGVLYDRDALGIYKIDEETLTTPVNARARYYCTYTFAEQLWFNDLGENFLFFTLN